MITKAEIQFKLGLGTAAGSGDQGGTWFSFIPFRILQGQGSHPSEQAELWSSLCLCPHINNCHEFMRFLLGGGCIQKHLCVFLQTYIQEYGASQLGASLAPKSNKSVHIISPLTNQYDDDDDDVILNSSLMSGITSLPQIKYHNKESIFKAAQQKEACAQDSHFLLTAFSQASTVLLLTAYSLYLSHRPT
ncbi:hypothetical protein H8959_014240 [Pygathrix nigripes]